MPCAHRETITTITAGIAREVCEGCGRLRISFVEPAVRAETRRRSRPVDSVMRMLSDPRHADDETVAESLRFLKCRLCRQAAVFMIPSGVVCDEHAWQAAARLDWDYGDPWVPIRIHTKT